MLQNILLTILAFILSSVFGFFMIPQIMNFCKRKKLYDIPNERKVHKNAIPRLGGISFMPSMLLAFFLAIIVMDHITGEEPLTISLWTCSFFISLVLIYGIGIVDDLIGLGAKIKFGVQIAAATLMPLSGLYINDLYGFLGYHEIPFWFGAPLTVFIIVFIDNAINLIDGIDGLAGGLAFLALGGFLACFLREGVITYSILISGLMGVLIPYLYFNIWGSVENNRKIFMGDSGSLTLGFILDVVRVVIMRLRRRRPLFDADKNHIHHKLMRMGLSQHHALSFILCMALFFAVINLVMVFLFDTHLTYVLLVDILVFIGINTLVNHRILQRGEKPFV